MPTQMTSQHQIIQQIGRLKIGIIRESNEFLIASVYDGHGGWEIADAVVRKLPPRIEMIIPVHTFLWICG